LSDKEKGGKEKEIPADAARRVDKAAFRPLQGDFGQAHHALLKVLGTR